jgi:hypothetical protein
MTSSVSGQNSCWECGRVWRLQRVEGRLCLPLCGLVGRQRSGFVIVQLTRYVGLAELDGVCLWFG